MLCYVVLCYVYIMIYVSVIIFKTPTQHEGIPKRMKHLVDTLFVPWWNSFSTFPAKTDEVLIHSIRLTIRHVWDSMLVTAGGSSKPGMLWRSRMDWKLCFALLLWSSFSCLYQIKKITFKQPTIRPLLESMVQILRNRPMTHLCSKLLNQCVAILLPFLGAIVTISSELSGILVAFQGCWQFQYISSSHPLDGYNNRHGLFHTLPIYTNIKVPRKLKCSQRLNLNFVSK